MLRAGDLSGIDCGDAGVAENVDQFLCARLPGWCQERVCIVWIDNLFAVAHKNDGRNRPRESGEVSKDDNRAEDGKEHRKDDDGTDSRPRCGGFVHYD